MGGQDIGNLAGELGQNGASVRLSEATFCARTGQTDPTRPDRPDRPDPTEPTTPEVHGSVRLPGRYLTATPHVPRMQTRLTCSGARVITVYCNITLSQGVALLGKGEAPIANQRPQLSHTRVQQNLLYQPENCGCGKGAAFLAFFSTNWWSVNKQCPNRPHHLAEHEPAKKTQAALVPASSRLVPALPRRGPRPSSAPASDQAPAPAQSGTTISKPP